MDQEMSPTRLSNNLPNSRFRLHRSTFRRHQPRALESRRRGAMLVLVAITVVILLIGAVFSVDVAYMHMVRAELRTATDAAARAGAQALAETQNPGLARQAAIAAAERNQVAGEGLTLQANNIDIGTSVERNGRQVFQSNQQPFTAVRVVGGRGGGFSDSEVPLFFSRLFSANSFSPEETATASATVRDVALVLDVSGSMFARSGNGTRLDALKRAVQIFISEINQNSPNTQISLATYATSASKLLPLTKDLGLVSSRVNQLRASGATAIGLGLQVGSDSLLFDPLARDFAAKTVVVMTDGNHNRGVSPVITAQTAAARGQTVHTVTFSAGANQALMRQVAQTTRDGIHIHADSNQDLEAAFREIAETISVTLIE